VISHPLPRLEHSNWLYLARLLPQSSRSCLSSPLAAAADTDTNGSSLAPLTVQRTKHGNSLSASRQHWVTVGRDRLQRLDSVWLHSALFCYRSLGAVCTPLLSALSCFQPFAYRVCITCVAGSVPGKAMPDLWWTKPTVRAFLLSGINIEFVTSEVFTAETMKNAVLWYIKAQFLPHSRHINISATEPIRLMLCKTLVFHDGAYEECRSLGCDAVWFL
jgi:hypothetical protein